MHTHRHTHKGKVLINYLQKTRFSKNMEMKLNLHLIKFRLHKKITLTGEFEMYLK